MANYRATETGSEHAGTIANAGPGDTVRIYSTATGRHDWAPIATAAMTAFARGADVRLIQVVPNV